MGMPQIQIKAERVELSPCTVAVESREPRKMSVWDRARIANALVREANLDREVAVAISQTVEARVIRSGLKVISTALIRELVDSELFERGATVPLTRQSSVSIPKRDLEQLLFHGGDPARGHFVGDPQQVASLLGQLLLRQYALEEIYSADVRQADFEGLLHIHQLEGALQLLRAPLFADRIALTTADRGAERGAALRALFRRLRELQPLIAEELEVVRLGEALVVDRLREHDAVDLSDAPAEYAARLVQALESFSLTRETLPGRPPTVTMRVPFVPRLVSTQATSGGLFAGGQTMTEDAAFFLVEVLRSALADERGRVAVQACAWRFEVSAATFSERRFSEVLQYVLSRMTRETSVSFAVDSSAARTRQGSHSRPFAAGERQAEGRPTRTERHDAARVTAGKVTINLARIALDCRARNTREVQSALSAAMERGVEALRERAAFLNRVAAHPAGPLKRWLTDPRDVLIADDSPAGESSHSDDWTEVAEQPGQKFGQNLGENLGQKPATSVDFALGVIALAEAVELLWGAPMHSSEVLRRRGREFIELLSGTLSACRRVGDPRIILEETANRGPLRRFEALDRERFSALVGATSSGQPGRASGSYAHGVRFARNAPIDPLECWTESRTYQDSLVGLDRLDDIGQLRKEGVEVLIAFLEEACR
ncbi:MAG: anaerobic ribonucleoside-triphosphate reductase [Planctomycetota bacterium]